MPSKRPNETDEPVDENDMLEFVALGGGSEVGRSCHIISYKGKTIMLDAGVHPAYSGLSGLPFYDEYDLSTVDILLISHFHVDHAASLPYVMQHTDFKGRVFMTHPTKAIIRWLLSDFVRVANGSGASGNAPLYTDVDLANCFDKIEVVDYHSTMEVDGIKFTAYHAGHVLGAAMFFVEIGNVKFLFTGDYSREENRHLSPAEVPPKRPDILISESTYGTASHLPRNEKENRLTSLIYDTVTKGGRVLMPVFALGNAQELLLILDEYWDSHPELDNVNIYYASSLARKCLAVYQTYINMMNPNIRKRIRDHHTNPFHFRHVKNLRNLEKFDDIGPCVMLASPGMLQNGFSRELLERWCPDPKNTLLMTGYSVEGTMAKQIINEPTEIPSVVSSNTKIARRCLVEEISFAAHVDYQQNSQFIEMVNPSIIILVHGEANNMGRLKSALLSKYQHLKNTNKEVKIFNPKNCEEVRLPFRSVKLAKTMGVLAEKPPVDGQILSGIAVQKDFEMSILAPTDLKEYTALNTTVLLERQTVIVEASTELIKFHLEQMFGSVAESDKDDYKMTVMDAVSIRHKKNVAIIEWAGNAINDTIADCVVGILLSVDSSPTSVRLSSQPCNHGENGAEAKSSHHHHHLHENISNQQRKTRMLAFLQAQFGDAISVVNEVDQQKQSNGDNKTELFDLQIEIDGRIAKINLDSLDVQCDFVPLAKRVSHILDQSADTIAPLSASLIQQEEYEFMEEDQDTEMSDIKKGPKIEDNNAVKMEPAMKQEKIKFEKAEEKVGPENVKTVLNFDESAPLEKLSEKQRPDSVEKKQETSQYIPKSVDSTEASQEKRSSSVEDNTSSKTAKQATSEDKSSSLNSGAETDNEEVSTKPGAHAGQADFEQESPLAASNDKTGIDKSTGNIPIQEDLPKDETPKAQTQSTAEDASKVKTDKLSSKRAVDPKDGGEIEFKPEPSSQEDSQIKNAEPRDESSSFQKSIAKEEGTESESKAPNSDTEMVIEEPQTQAIRNETVERSTDKINKSQDVVMTDAGEKDENVQESKIEKPQVETVLPEAPKVGPPSEENATKQETTPENAKLQSQPPTSQSIAENDNKQNTKRQDAKLKSPKIQAAKLDTVGPLKTSKPAQPKVEEPKADGKSTDNSTLIETKALVSNPSELEPIKTEGVELESKKPELVKTEPVKTEDVKPGSTNADTGKSEPTKVEKENAKSK